MEFLHSLWTMLRHLSPESVAAFTDQMGPMMYVVLFAIIFCETGLVVMPFLPGDSLLFAVGAAVASNHNLSLPLVAVLLCVAANLGDVVNYFVGSRLGPRIFRREGAAHALQPVGGGAALNYETPSPKPTLFERLLNRKHLDEAHAFYEKHGRKAIIIARFVPIVRTFAPFVAGIGRMSFARFIVFSITGGALWVVTCLTAGYELAKVDFVKKHFEVVVLAIIVVSLIPVAVSYLKSRKAAAV